MASAQDFDIDALKRQFLEHLGTSADIYPAHIEQQFPHILAKLVELWGKPPMDAYLKSLMVSDRPNRQGFPSSVATEIFRLSVLHSTLGVTQEPKTMGWASVSDGDIAKLFEKAVR